MGIDLARSGLIVTDVLKCPRCDGDHAPIACPYVKAIEFDPGAGLIITRLEFLTPADYGPSKPVAVDDEAPEYPKLGAAPK